MKRRARTYVFGAVIFFAGFYIVGVPTKAQNGAGQDNREEFAR